MTSRERPNLFRYRRAGEPPGQRRDPTIISNPLEHTYEKPLRTVQGMMEAAEWDLDATLRDYYRTIGGINKLSAELKKLKHKPIFLKFINFPKEKIQEFEAERARLITKLQGIEAELARGRKALDSIQHDLTAFRKSWLPHLDS